MKTIGTTAAILASLLISMASITSMTGCGASQPSVVAARATREFSCPKDQVVVEQLGGSSYRAHGCGQVATFTCMGGNVGNPYDAMCTKEATTTAAQVSR